jgi:Ca-activated chloride channel family protein
VTPLRRGFLLLASFLVCVAAAPRQSPPQLPTFHSEASLVALNVTVQDRAAKYVSGLKPEDFAVYEDGVRQDVRFCEAESVPVDLIVLLDTSASMTNKIMLVREAADGFLKTLRPGDRGAVVAFSDNVDVLQPLTDDRQALSRAVASISPQGATSLYNAIYIALKSFGHTARHNGDVRRQAIAVLSDGDDTTSLVSFDDVLGLARRMGVNIYTVGLQSPAEMKQAVEETGRRFLSEANFTMKTLSRETGALSFFPTVIELKNVYGSIAQELGHQYSIGYVPANSHFDGRFRHVAVQVISRPELRPRTRLGYTADGAL